MRFDDVNDVDDEQTKWHKKTNKQTISRAIERQSKRVDSI